MDARVHIVDDDKFSRESLQWLIESVNLPVVSYETGQSFLDNTEKSQSGCLVLDVRMPDINGMELFKKIREKHYGLPVIIMTGHADVAMAVRAMKSGAFDFIEKPYNDSVMLERIQSAIAFDLHCQKDRLQIEGISKKLDSLTPREKQVLERVVNSVPNKCIADELAISIKTVELHRSNLMGKMDANSATELVRQVMQVDYFNTLQTTAKP